jgi:hypothetical protein
MQIFYITKLGCNVSIKVTDDISGNSITYFEDSSNVLMQLNPISLISSIEIKGNKSFSTLNISTNNVLYMNPSGTDILINSEASYLTNYALVFACATGGGGGGAVNSVTASLPLSSSGGANPNISISQSGTASNGYLNSTDWNTFNNKVGGSGVATRVAFWDSVNTISSNAQLYWDNINNRLGVGGTPYGYKLSVLDANYFARFGTTAGSDANAITFGKSTSAGIGLFGAAAERKILIGDGGTGYANFTAYSDNIIQFSYSSAVGGAQLSSALTLFTGNFFYTTGTNSHTQIYLKPSIQTSGGTNLLRGIYYAPIKTTDVGTTQIAWENTEGDIIFGNLSTFAPTITYVDVNGKLGLSYLINDTTQQILNSVDLGNNHGININFANSVYEFGAYDYGNGTKFVINDYSNVVYFYSSYVSGGADGFYMEFATGRYLFGDVSHKFSGIFLECSNGDNSAFFNYNGDNNGLTLQFADDLYNLGNYITEDAYINVNASGKKINFISKDGKYNFKNIPAYNDNAAALAAGLVVGDIYRHGNGDTDQLNIVH